MEEIELTIFPTTPMQPQKSFSHSATHSFTLPIASRRQRGKLVPLVQASWAIVIARYTNEQSISFACSVENALDHDAAAHPKEPGREPTTHALTVLVGSDVLLAEVLKQLEFSAQSTTPKDSEEHSQTKLVVASGLPNSTLLPSLLEIRFEHIRKFSISDRLNGIEKSFYSTPFLLRCSIGLPRFTLYARFDSRLIDEIQVRRIFRQHEAILHQLLETMKPGLCKDIGVVSPTDVAELALWNRKEQFAVESCVHDLIELQAQVRSDAVAICAWDGSLTYDELWQLTSRIASKLRALGIGKNCVVPLAFEKSKWVVIALLAVLKTGAAFVLLEVSQPISHLEKIITKVQAEIVLCGRTVGDRFSNTAINILILDELFAEQFSITTSTPQSPQTSPRDIAYLVFTSGSSGEPKGVLIEHRAYSSGVFQQARGLHISSSSRVLQLASYSFSACIVEILTTLVVGGCICIPSISERFENLVGAMNKYQVTWTVMPASATSILEPGAVPSLVTLAVGGEALASSVVQKWACGVEFIHAYGQSEGCTINSAVVLKSPAADPRNIGRAFAVTFWIVDPDDHNRLYSIGAVGELVIEGISIGTEYLHDQTQTGLSFIGAPKWTELFPGRKFGRFYKVGDLAKYDSDGNVLILGRKDCQAKLRGQRIELAEVEHHIRSFLASWDLGKQRVVAEVVHQISPDATAALAVFITLSDQFKSTKVNSAHEAFIDIADAKPELKLHMSVLAAQMEAQLSQQIPAYMVPSIFIPIRSLPLTSSGKTDRRILREWASGKTIKELKGFVTADESGQHLLASSEKERVLQGLWSKVLKIPEHSISTSDTFFRLGGNSMTAMLLVSAARSEGFGLRMNQIFETPMLSELAQEMHTCDSITDVLNVMKSIPYSLISSTETVAIIETLAIERTDISDIMPVTEFQQRALHQAQSPSRALTEYLLFSFNGTIDTERLRTSCNRLIAHHNILRTVFVESHGRIFQCVLRNFTPDWTARSTTKDLIAFSEELCDEDMLKPVTFGTPIAKFWCIRGEQDRSQMILRLNHAQMDGMSVQTLWRDLRSAYLGEQLPDTTSFALYIHATECCRTAEGYKYWSALLAGAQIPQLSSQNPSEPCNPVDLTLKQTVPLPVLLSPTLTTATLLKAAWTLVLATRTNQTDISFAQLVSTRNLPGVPSPTSTIGPCINESPVRVRLQPQWTVRDLLIQIQSQHIASMPYESFGIQDIIATCTDWPAGTRFSSTLLHQNFEDVRTFDMGAGVTCELGLYERQPDLEDVLVVSTPVGGELEISLSVSENKFPKAEAEAMLRGFCGLVEEIPKCLDEVLVGLKGWGTGWGGDAEVEDDGGEFGGLEDRIGEVAGVVEAGVPIHEDHSIHIENPNRWLTNKRKRSSSPQPDSET